MYLHCFDTLFTVHLIYVGGVATGHFSIVVGVLFFLGSQTRVVHFPCRLNNN